MLNNKAAGKSNFLISNAKKAFNHLKQVFIKTLILKHFDLENHIQIKVNILGYTKSALLS